MALIKEPYGLVRNTDGTLCTTYRDDVVPFRGVRSFAVETATTNYLAPYAWEFDSEKTLFYPSGLASGKTWADCWDEKQKAYVGGDGLTCIRIYTRSIDLGSVQAAGTKITLSWKHKGYFRGIYLSHSLDNTTFTAWNSADTIEFKGDSSFNNFFGNLYIGIKIDGKYTDYRGQPEQLLDRWYNVEITYTLPSDARYIEIRWSFFLAYQANDGLGVLGYIRQPQLEIKPFASSFVNGSRPKGRLVVPKELLGFNPATDDWVVHYWKYPVATRNDTLTSSNLSSFGKVSKGYYFSWGKAYRINSFLIRADYNDDTFIEVRSPTFNPDNYFRHWHSEVILKHNGTIEYWVDGILQCQVTLTKSLPNYGIMGLQLCGTQGINSDNSYIANLYYGLYTDQWTDEYIREVYEAKIPFAVQNQLSIY